MFSLRMKATNRKKTSKTRFLISISPTLSSGVFNDLFADATKKKVCLMEVHTIHIQGETNPTYYPLYFLILFLRVMLYKNMAMTIIAINIITRTTTDIAACVTPTFSSTFTILSGASTKLT